MVGEKGKAAQGGARAPPPRRSGASVRRDGSVARGGRSSGALYIQPGTDHILRRARSFRRGTRGVQASPYLPKASGRVRSGAGAGSVVRYVNSGRTQNGHIRNDTRVVSRRISSVSTRPICRGNCVTSDRACTRVTPAKHGK